MCTLTNDAVCEGPNQPHTNRGPPMVAVGSPQTLHVTVSGIGQSEGEECRTVNFSPQQHGGGGDFVPGQQYSQFPPYKRRSDFGQGTAFDRRQHGNTGYGGRPMNAGGRFAGGDFQSGGVDGTGHKLNEVHARTSVFFRRLKLKLKLKLKLHQRK